MDRQLRRRTALTPSRRRFVVGLVGIAGAGLLAACQQGATTSPAAPKAAATPT